MNIEDSYKDQPLSEIGHGSTEVYFAYVHPKNNKTYTPFAKCKDFFNDMFWTKKTGNPVSIYGFKFTKSQDKGDLEEDILVLAIRMSNRNDKKVVKPKEDQLASILTLLNKIEKKLKFKLTEGLLTDDQEYIVLRYDKKWSEIPYLNSAFFFFMRLGITYNKDTDFDKQFSDVKNFISPNDAMYYKSAKQRVEDIMKGKLDTKQKYEDYTAGTIHNGSGLVNYKNYSL